MPKHAEAINLVKLDNARHLWALSAETLEITDGGFQKWGVFNSWMVLHWEIKKKGWFRGAPSQETFI